MTRENLRLRSADMVAVLERTGLRPNADNFLLPLFECVSNSIHSIFEAFPDEISKGEIEIEVSLDPTSMLIKDNGAGLNFDNMGAFLTPFTGQKLKKGGKGFGRFIAFKVFEEVLYASRHRDNDNDDAFAFRFDVYADHEVTFVDVFTTFLGGSGCSVQLSGLRSPFQDISERITADEIVDRVVRYFLPYFITGRMPNLKLVVDGTSYAPSDRFKSLFTSEKIVTEKIDIDGELHEFNIGTSLSEKGKMFPRHAMLLFADDRVIGSGRSLEGKIGTPHFTGKDGRTRVAIASVSGDFLNSRANTARTDIEASEDEIDAIANRVSEIILDQQNEYREERRGEQTKGLTSVFMRNPLLRTALKQTPSDYVRSKPMSWGPEQFVSDLDTRKNLAGSTIS